MRTDYPTLKRFSLFFGAILAAAFLIGLGQAYRCKLSAILAEPWLVFLLASGLVVLGTCIAVYLLDGWKRIQPDDPHEYGADDARDWRK